MSLKIIEDYLQKMKRPKLKLVKGYPKGKTEEQILEESYDIALANEFYVDRQIYDDHIVGNPDFRPYFLIDKKGQIKGLTVVEFQKVKELTLCYVGLVFVHPDAQGLGWSKRLMTKAVKDCKEDPDLIVIRSQNERMIASFFKTFGNKLRKRDIRAYLNAFTNRSERQEQENLIQQNGLCIPNKRVENPTEVVEILRELPCAPNLDKNLKVPDAYPNQFVSQVSKDSDAGELCSSLAPKDALIAAVVKKPAKVLQKSLVPKINISKK